MMQKRIIEMKRRTMEILSLLSNWKRHLAWLHLKRDKYSRQNVRRRNSALTIRRRVPVDRLLFLVFVLMIPQLVLQILNVAVPAMREIRATHYDDEIMVAYQKCERPSGLPSFVVGVVLALCPYFLTYLLSFDSSSLPDVFDELHAFMRACHICLIVTVGSVPAAALARTPDTKLYATTFLVVFGAATPPIRFIVVQKLKPIWQGEKVVVVGHLLRRLGRPTNRSQRRRRTSIVDDADDTDAASRSATQTSSSQDDRQKRRQQAEANEKAANLALTIAKMYEDIGQAKKTVQIYDDALNLWKTEHNRREKVLVGDYTEDEINCLCEKEVTMICNLLIAKGRVLGSLVSDDSRATSKAAEAWLDALDVFAFAPAAANIKDRSLIFPCFSGIFVFLKGGKIQKPASFEGDLVRRFVAETKKHYDLAGDSVHYARALAMQAELLAKDSRFEEALDVFASMKTVYDIDEHSDLVSKHYGTDRCAQAYAFSALWYIEVGKKELGMRSCEHVIGSFLDKMSPENVLNFNVTLLPIIKLLKSKGEAGRARELYEKYVIKNYEKHFKDGAKTPAKPLMKPMMLLLKLCSEEPGPYDGMDDDLEYMAVADNGLVPAMLDNVYTSLCWSLSSLSAEICLLLAERVLERNANTRDLAFAKILLRKGLSLARNADASLKDEEGGVRFKLAYETHEPILCRLEELAVQHSIDLSVDAQDLSRSMGDDPRRHVSYPRRRMTMDTLHGLREETSGSAAKTAVTFGVSAPRRASGDVPAQVINDDSPPPVVSRGQLPVISAVSGDSEFQPPEAPGSIPTTLAPLKKDGDIKRLDRRASGTSSKGSIRSLASSILGAFSGKRKDDGDAFEDDDSLSDDEDGDIEACQNEENVLNLNGSADLDGGENRLSLPAQPPVSSNMFRTMKRASKQRFVTK
jgi:tetratricopeptide (TPR) repeat protein